MAGVVAVEEALPALEESDAACITFVGSMASKFFFFRSSYGPAKAAMRAYANELAQSLGQKGIRANAISPGAIYFPGGEWDRRKLESPEFYARLERAIPLGRLGSGEEIARIIAFVSSPAGMWINSAHIVADGGRSRRSTRFPTRKAARSFRAATRVEKPGRPVGSSGSWRRRADRWFVESPPILREPAAVTVTWAASYLSLRDSGAFFRPRGAQAERSRLCSSDLEQWWRCPSKYRLVQVIKDLSVQMRATEPRPILADNNL